MLTILDFCLKREGASASALLLKGKALRRQKQLSEAINCVRNAEILEPDNTDILRFLAECYAQQNRFEEELEYLQRLSELLPEDRTLRRLIPVTMSKLGRNEEAMQLLFKLDYESTENDEDYNAVIALIADTALSLGKIDIAERYTEKELEKRDEGLWMAQMRMGHIKLLQGDMKSAIDHYEQFINIYCKENGEDIKVALNVLNANWSKRQMVNGQMVTSPNLLLIHDILQASSDKSLQNP